jgi:hypothetical protein
MNMQQAVKNPNAAFASPEVLESSTESTTVEKRAILTQWKDQLEKLRLLTMRACCALMRKRVPMPTACGA